MKRWLCPPASKYGINRISSESLNFGEWVAEAVKAFREYCGTLENLDCL